MQNIGYEQTLSHETAELAAAMGERGDLSPEHRAQLYVAASKHFLQWPRERLTAEQALTWVRDHSPPDFVERNLSVAREFYQKFASRHPKK